jgi:aspartate kinase
VASATLEPLRGVVAAEIETSDEMGKVSIVGAGMKSHPGVAATVFRTLGENGINIDMISTSPIKISCVIPAARVRDAVRALHAAFELGEGAIQAEQPFGKGAAAVGGGRA